MHVRGRYNSCYGVLSYHAPLRYRQCDYYYYCALRDLHLAGIEDEINTSADKSIAAIRRDREKLLSEAESIKQKQVKQVETVRQEVEQYATALESFTRYSETLLSRGTACDVTRSANSLHERADELMKFDVIGHVDSSLPPGNVTFTSSTLLDREDRNLVGTVTEVLKVS